MTKEQQGVARRDWVKYAGGAIAGLVIGGAAGYLAKPSGVATTVTAPGGVPATVTETATQTVSTTVSTVASPLATIVAIFADLNGSFTVPVKASVPDTSSLLNINMKITGVTGLDFKSMADIFSATIAEKPDGIMIEEVDPSFFPLTKQAISQGVPVVSCIVDDANSLTDPHPSGRLAYIGTDMRLLATMVAADILPQIQALSPPKGAEVAIFLSRPGAPDEETRATGYKDVLEAAGFTCTEHMAGPSTVDQAEPLVESYLTSHPGVVGALGVDGVASMGLAGAVRKLNLKGKVIAAGFDVTSDALAAVADGTFYALANQQPYICVPQAALTLLAYKLSGGLIRPWNSATGAGVIDSTNAQLFVQNASSKYVGAA